MLIIRTELGNYLVVSAEYGGGTYYDADTYEEALAWCRERGIEIDEDDFRDHYTGKEMK